ncbi:MAG: M1 family aminopeptidase [Bacteroidia bacterium]|nr:M1 family aminopeptidase [Bacteroidia bacterium]
MKKNHCLKTLFGILGCISLSLAQSQKDSILKRPYVYDPNYRATNTLIVDILHTNLYVKPIWDSSILIGKAEIILKPYFYPTRQIFLNARGMRLNKIQINDYSNKTLSLPFTYQYENDSIKIQLNKTILPTQTLVINIDYVAQPEKIKIGGSAAIQSDKGLYFINPKGEIPGKMPQIWTQGETQSNSVWFPTVDSPNEKMTHDIYITVDKKYTTLSNGILVESIPNKDGTKTDHWKMALPHAPYLVMMGIGEFKKITDTPWKGKEISYYVEPQYAPYAKAIFANTSKMITFFSNKLGVDYAWPKYSQIICRDYVSGAMENTSATLHGEFLHQTDRDTVGGVKGEDVIAHELFHQWFGDLVTCESWSNLPLNESFATYGEYLWEEYYRGRDAADEHHYFSKKGYINNPPHKNPPLIRFFYENREEMFDNISYNKGGQVLHMLRKLVGDSAFFQSLKYYLTQNKFKTAEIHHLRLAFEEITGQDLNWFFNQWFMYGGHPELTIQKNYDNNAKLLTLKVKQEQPIEYPIYRLPLYVDIYTSKSVERKFIDIQQAEQTFTFTVNENPLLVNFDAERQLLAKINYTKTLEEYLYQFEHAPLWEDRYEAITKIGEEYKNQEKTELLNFLLNKGLADKYHRIRSMVIDFIKPKITSDEKVKNKIIELSQKDPSPNVKEDALEALASLKDNTTLNIYKNVIEKEYGSGLIAAALKGINSIDKNLAQEYAKKFEQEKSKRIILALVSIYSETGNEKYWDYLKTHLSTFTGFETFMYIGFINKYLKNLNHSGTAIAAAKTLVQLYNNSEKMAKYPIKKTLMDLVKNWSEKESNLKNALTTNKQNNEPTQNIEEQLKTVSETLKTLKEITQNI